MNVWRENMKENIPGLLDVLPRSAEIRARAIRDLITLLPETSEQREAAKWVTEEHRRKVVDELHRGEGATNMAADRLRRGSPVTQKAILDAILDSRTLIDDRDVYWRERSNGRAA